MFDQGIVIGKFAPLTLGHINLINIAATECDHLTVIVSHDNRWLAKQSTRDQRILTLKNRVRWLNQIYKDIPHISIKYIVEDEVPEFPNGWKGYCGLLEEVMYMEVIKPQTTSIAIFSSEPSYTENYAKYLPYITHVVVDSERTKVPISATEIRENLYKNWEFLPSIVRKDYAQKIVVIGTESSGKTTLVKYLAKLYNTSWVEEYGRTFCEVDLNMQEWLLESKDYTTIAFKHKELEAEAYRTANRLTFIDTNAFITEFYHRLYEGKPNPVVTAIALEEHYDLVIVLSPTVKWVDDGLRINSNRDKTTKLFNEMSKEFPNQFPEGRTVYIDSPNYKQRLTSAIDAVDRYLSKVNQGSI